jgi:transposase-like protein
LAYRYRAVDSASATIECMLSPNRDLIAAKMFLRLALFSLSSLRVINVDGRPAYRSTINELAQSGETEPTLSLSKIPLHEQHHRARPSIH